LKITDYQVLFLTVVAVVALLVASPALSRLLVLPRTEFFTELWLLGPNQKAEDYPFNLTSNQNSSVFLGIRNQLGYAAYYLVMVKFRNQTQSAPSSFGPLENRTPSEMPSLYNITAFVADEEVWEKSLTFSINYVHNASFSKVDFHGLELNEVALELTNYEAMWDPSRNEFLGNLFFELWLYNMTTSSFQYHARFVSLRLNMTTP
jgi:hypothetical protein